MDIDMSSLQKNLQSSINQFHNIQESMDRVNELEAQKKATAYQADLEVIEQSKVLREIADNTTYMKGLVTIVRDIKQNSDELNHILSGIYSIAESQTKEEAATNFSRAVSKISESGEFLGNTANIVSVFMGIYNTVIMMIDK